MISRLLIDGYLNQEFVEQRSSTITAYFRPGSNAVQLISPNVPNSNGIEKIHIELRIRIETASQTTVKTDEDIQTTRQRTIEQINELCLAELKEELKSMAGSNNYATILSDRALELLVKVMP